MKPLTREEEIISKFDPFVRNFLSSHGGKSRSVTLSRHGHITDREQAAV